VYASLEGDARWPIRCRKRTSDLRLLERPEVKHAPGVTHKSGQELRGLDPRLETNRLPALI